MPLIEPDQYWICEADTDIYISELKHLIFGFKGKLKFKFSSLLVQGNVNYNDISAVVYIFPIFKKRIKHCRHICRNRV